MNVQSFMFLAAGRRFSFCQFSSSFFFSCIEVCLCVGGGGVLMIVVPNSLLQPLGLHFRKGCQTKRINVLRQAGKKEERQRRNCMQNSYR